MSGLTSVRQPGEVAWNLAAVYLLIAGVWAVAGVSWESPLESDVFCLNRMAMAGSIETWTASDQTFLVDSIVGYAGTWWSPVEPAFAAQPSQGLPRALAIQRDPNRSGQDSLYAVLGGAPQRWRTTGDGVLGMRQACILTAVDTSFANLRRLFEGTRWQCARNCT